MLKDNNLIGKCAKSFLTLLLPNMTRPVLANSVDPDGKVYP